MDSLVNSGVVPVIMRFLLDLRDGNDSGEVVTVTLKYELQRGCVLVLSLLAVKVIDLSLFLSFLGLIVIDIVLLMRLSIVF